MVEIPVVLCCIQRDMQIAGHAVWGLQKFITTGPIFIVVPPHSVSQFKKVFGRGVEVIDETELTCGISLQMLEGEKVYGFPDRAGWYLQQFAKLGFARTGNPDEFYLIWDSDTVPTRPFSLFNKDGTPYYVMADERNEPYWETFQNLFGFKPEYRGSFISQHMIVNKSIAQDMLSLIEQNNPECPNWIMAIIKNLSRTNHISLFSEYETYGYFLSSKYPHDLSIRKSEWLRYGALHSISPSRRLLRRLGHKYDYVAFESWQIDEGKMLEQRRSISWRIKLFLNEFRKKISSKKKFFPS